MSQEFWLGVLVSGALFAAGSLISIFGSDIRRYVMEWRRNRALRGNSLRLAKLERELALHTLRAENPGLASAFFWSGLFLLIVLLMLLVLMFFLIYQLQSPSVRQLLWALFGVAWITCYAVANELHSKADQLRHPTLRSELLKKKIERLRGKQV